ncbi:biofilm-forming protein [Metabacillus malikii]|nr:biofilm-forming protein [Metabacillus malikii]
MTKKGIQNSSIEQIQHDHETESAFKEDNVKKQNKNAKRNK